MANQRSVRSAPRGWFVLLAVSTSGVLAGLDGTAVVIAGPKMAQAVHASQGQLQWIANAYLVALAIGLLPAGRFADRFGRRRTFILGTLAFGLLSVLIGLSTSATALIALRAAQGVAGALMQPAAFALLRVSFPRGQLNFAIGVLTASTAAAAAAGPIIAGTIVQHLDWPAVFYLNTPLSVITAVLVRWSVAESRVARGHQASVRDVLRIPGVAAGTALVAASYFAIYGLLFVLTLYLQNLRGMDPIRAGMWMLPLSAVVVLSAPLGGVLTERFGPRRPALSGMILLTAALAGLSVTDAETPIAGFAPVALVGGFGAGLALVAGTQAIVAVAPATMSGLASAVQQMVSQLGGVVGIATLGAVLTSRVGHVLPERLTEAGVPIPLSEGASARVDTVAQGITAVPEATPEHLAVALVSAGSQAFLEGLHAALWVAAAVAIAGGLVSLLIRSPAEVADLHEMPEPATDVRPREELSASDRTEPAQRSPEVGDVVHQSHR